MYFSSFPYIFYDVEKTGNERKATHILKRIAFRQKVKDRANLFYTHYVQDGETPELLAHKMYGNAQYHWVILLLNERHNPYFDWPMGYQAFQAYLATKYPGKSLIFTADSTDHYTVGETVTGGTSSATGTVTKWFPTLRQLVVNVGSGTFQNNETITGGTSNTVRTTLSSGGTVNYIDAPHHYTDINNNEVNIAVANSAPSNREYEDNINETNRSIKLLKPEFLSAVVEEFQSLLRN